MTFIILRNHEETLKHSSLPLLKQRLVSWYSQYFNNLFILHQMSEEKTEKWIYGMRIKSAYAQRISFSLMYRHTQFRTKHSLNLGLKEWIAHTVTLKHSK